MGVPGIPYSFKYFEKYPISLKRNWQISTKLTQMNKIIIVMELRNKGKIILRNKEFISGKHREKDRFFRGTGITPSPSPRGPQQYF